jgi:hypothetical protein
MTVVSFRLKEHNISKTDSVSISRLKQKPTQFDALDGANLHLSRWLELVIESFLCLLNIRLEEKFQTEWCQALRI